MSVAPPIRSDRTGTAAAPQKTRPAPIPVPEPNLTPKQLIARAASFRDRLRAEQDESDERGTYSPQLHEEFVKAGFYRITQPRLFGGYEFDLGTFYRVMLEISRGHPGAGWCLTLAASHAFEIASHWSEQAQRELFGDGHFVCPHRAPPLGTLKKVDGGYLMNGTWDYASGVPYCTHFIGGCFIDRPGPDPRGVGHAIVSRSAITILDDWGGDRVLGMRASGSNGVKVENVFVPEHHVGYLSPGLGATFGAEGTPGTRLHGNPMYLGCLAGPFHVSLIVPIVGAARASLEEYEETIKTRKTLSLPQIARFEHADFQRSFGEALTLADAAEALMFKACELYHEYCQNWAETGVPITVEQNMRLWGIVQHAGDMACRAVEGMFHSGGSSLARKGSRLQRYFNDVAMYRGHSSSQMLAFEAGLARLRFGLPWGMYGL
jgi:3-hydroxy-9,10-secoandrosta-1,3,5(10)-triene-9,17-dione monooxygenase